MYLKKNFSMQSFLLFFNVVNKEMCPVPHCKQWICTPDWSSKTILCTTPILWIDQIKLSCVQHTFCGLFLAVQRHTHHSIGHQRPHQTTTARERAEGEGDQRQRQQHHQQRRLLGWVWGEIKEAHVRCTLLSFVCPFCQPCKWKRLALQWLYNLKYNN